MSCAHATCKCTTANLKRDGAAYCSDICHGLARTKKDLPCLCNHASCPSPEARGAAAVADA